MITLKTIEDIRELASTIGYKNCTAKCVDGSILSVLAKESRPTIIPSAEDNGYREIEDAIIQRSVSKDTVGAERHHIELKQATNLLAANIGNTLNFARNTINPLIKELISKCQEASTQARLGINIGLDITPLEANGVYFDPTLEVILENTQRLQTTAKPLSESFADYYFMDVSAEQLRNTMKMGNGIFFDKLNGLLEGVDEEVYTNSTLLTEKIIPSNINPYTDHRALLALLLLVGIKAGSHPSMGDTDLDVNDISKINDAIDYYGFIVNQQIRAYNNDVTRQNIIISTNYYSVIYVHADNYQTWIEESGGTPEAVYGFILSNKDNTQSFAKQDSLRSDPAYFHKHYEKSLKRSELEGRINGNAEIDRILRQELHAEIRKHFADNDVLKKARQDRLDKYLIDNPYSHSFALDQHILRMACTVLTDGINDSYYVLNSMRGYLIDNPDSSPNEAAVIATAALLGKWLAGQIEIIED